MGIRPDALAGSWYPGSASALKGLLAECVAEGRRLLAESELGGRGPPVAIVAPHAGLAFSGGVAASAYVAVREALPKVDAFVVFGAAHRVRLDRAGIWASGSWRTPLGAIDVDEALADALIGAGVGGENEAAHAGDNAVELHTPFIKALFPEAKIVPVAMSFFPDSAALGKKASAAVRAAAPDKTVIAAASTDLTHYGAAFGVLPAGVGDPALEWTRKNDSRFLDALAALDLDGIVPRAERDGSACGAGAAAAAAGWAAERGARAGVVLAYATSHDIAPSGTAERFVGYGSVLYAAP